MQAAGGSYTTTLACCPSRSSTCRFGRGWKKVTEKVSDCVQGMPLGWLTGFMTALNTTWPHVDHLLINNGMSGGTWGALSEVRDDGGATSVGEACGRAGPGEA